LFSPGGIIAVVAVAAALLVVGYVVSRAAPKAPNTDRVTLTQSR
jgi:hypothetical protein